MQREFGSRVHFSPLTLNLQRALFEFGKMTGSDNESHKPDFAAKEKGMEEINWDDPFPSARSVGESSYTQNAITSIPKEMGTQDELSSPGPENGSETTSMNDADEPTTDGIPRDDPRPEGATFRRRQVQMLPICTLNPTGSM